MVILVESPDKLNHACCKAAYKVLSVVAQIIYQLTLIISSLLSFRSYMCALFLDALDTSKVTLLSELGFMPGDGTTGFQRRPS